MTKLRTGREMTRREFGKGLAAILAAGCSPSVAIAATRGAGGRVRGAAAAAAAAAYARSPHAYVQEGLVAMWDVENNVGYGARSATTDTWVDLSGNGHDAEIRLGMFAGDIFAVNGITTDGDCGAYVADLTGSYWGEIVTESASITNAGWQSGLWFFVNNNIGVGVNNYYFTCATSTDLNTNTATRAYPSTIAYVKYATMIVNGTSNTPPGGYNSRSYALSDDGLHLLHNWNGANIGHCGVRCIRLYDSFSAERYNANYEIDKLRFGMA